MVRTCEVALPLPLRTSFTYRIPDALDEVAVTGARVVVPFRNRSMLGVILERGNREDDAGLKEIAEVLDAIPALSPRLIELGRWVASYYLAPIGETLRAMLPPSVELKFKREWQINDAGRVRLQQLQSTAAPSETEVAELSLLQLCESNRGSISNGMLRKLPGGSAAAARLVRRNMLVVREEGRHRAPRTQKIVAWKEQAAPAPVRPAEARIFRVLSESGGPVPLRYLLKMAEVSRSVIERLLKEAKVDVWEEALIPEPVPLETDQLLPWKLLNEEQAGVVEEIRGRLQTCAFHSALLYGVTGSGKTEVYLRAVESTLALGRTAIILVPEIALTMWMARLCRARFGSELAVLHSGLSEQERAREWWRVRRNEARIVVGTRSAVFAPMEEIGLIVIDEEQESSYKQEETPRYHGRDVALMRAKLEGAVALLGSATPSLESFQRAREGKYKLLCLGSRVENRPMATVEISDLREDFRRTHSSAPISQSLHAAMARELAANKQSIVLINRRGYSWFALCRSCGTSVLCENCSIALTYHKKRERLSCHYCGFSRRVPRACPKCNSEHIYFVGAGAEQIEEHLRTLFPQARIARLDRDAVRKKGAFGQVLRAFGAGNIDILVGTQMVAKGHDFHGVTLVGVASADAQLGFPDFRAAERTFQLLTQVAGRAGRGKLPGHVIVESYHPEHYAIQLAARQDYVSFFEKELHFRRLMHYPPFAALASVLVRDAKLEKAIRWCRQIEAFFEAQKKPDIRMLGPAAAPLARLKREYRFHFLLKSTRRAALNQLLNRCLAYCAEKEIPDRGILVDVDPVNLL
jgi:primosomal protein N' (replication factor Y)